MQKNNKLMVAGPTEVEEEVRLAASQPMVYNRTPEFSEFLFKIEERLKFFFRTKNDVLIISSSGTGAMEATVVNILSPGDEVIIISGGTFGQRWYEIASCYQINCNVITVNKGERINPEVVRGAINDNTKAIFATANETSTGTLTDIEAIGKLVKDTNAIFVVDAISSLGSDLLETDKWYCDVVIASSQKALALPPGLSFITFSDKAWRMTNNSKLPKYYFNLKFYKENMIRGQTPFTPPVSLLYQLDIRLEKIIKVGMDEVINRQMEKALYVRKGLELLGLEIITKNPSNGVIGIMFPEEIDAFDVVKSLRNEYSIEIAPSSGEDKSRIARIGLFGNLTISDIDNLLCALKQLLQRYHLKT